ncbi:MAG: hypothetical protein HKM24_07985 [Gammaproteobacteria bacterium]|nr:hypothetical protein [Gammaproteobacteria bacterium]
MLESLNWLIKKAALKQGVLEDLMRRVVEDYVNAQHVATLNLECKIEQKSEADGVWCSSRLVV